MKRRNCKHQFISLVIGNCVTIHFENSLELYKFIRYYKVYLKKIMWRLYLSNPSARNWHHNKNSEVFHEIKNYFFSSNKWKNPCIKELQIMKHELQAKCSFEVFPLKKDIMKLIQLYSIFQQISQIILMQLRT